MGKTSYVYQSTQNLLKPSSDGFFVVIRKKVQKYAKKFSMETSDAVLRLFSKAVVRNTAKRRKNGEFFVKQTEKKSLFFVFSENKYIDISVMVC